MLLTLPCNLFHNFILSNISSYSYISALPSPLVSSFNIKMFKVIPWQKGSKTVLHSASPLPPGILKAIASGEFVKIQILIQ